MKFYLTIAALVFIAVVWGHSIVDWIETFRPQPQRITIIMPTPRVYPTATPVPTNTPVRWCMDGNLYENGMIIATRVVQSAGGGGCF